MIGEKYTTDLVRYLILSCIFDTTNKVVISYSTGISSLDLIMFIYFTECNQHHVDNMDAFVQELVKNSEKIPTSKS